MLSQSVCFYCIINEFGITSCFPYILFLFTGYVGAISIQAVSNSVMLCFVLNSLGHDMSFIVPVYSVSFA